MIRISDARMSRHRLRHGGAARRAGGGGRRAAGAGAERRPDRARRAARSLHLHVDDAELAARRAAWTPPPPHADARLREAYVDHVLQADEGGDFDFLVGCTRRRRAPRQSH